MVVHLCTYLYVVLSHSVNQLGSMIKCFITGIYMANEPSSNISTATAILWRW